MIVKKKEVWVFWELIYWRDSYMCIYKRWLKNEEFVKGECIVVNPPATCYAVHGLWIKEVAGTDTVYERGLQSLW